MEDKLKLKGRQVYIVACKRTPLGKFKSELAQYTAVELGVIAVNAAIESIKLKKDIIDQVVMGNCCSAGLGQNPARQVALNAGINQKVPCFTVNKVCASGMKAIALGCQSIQLGDADVVVCGGFESMSNIPYYVQNYKKGSSYSEEELTNGMMKDGLTDGFTQCSMGQYAEKTAADYKITREDNDKYAISSYQKAIECQKTDKFKKEIVPVPNKNKKEDMITEDEGPKKFVLDKISKLKLCFKQSDGTLTAASSSQITDGACALVLMSEDKIKELKLKPLAKIISYADAEVEPENFCIAPSQSNKICLQKVGLNIQDIDYFEINEAFSTTVLANVQISKIPLEKVNIYGGALALGHPLGMSGARIVGTLINILQEKKGKLGLAGICNGGGGASSILIQNCDI